jgi:hypothetical protein
MRRTIIAASVASQIFASQIASADPHKLLVLKSEGTADAATKTKVDAEVLRLARTISGITVESGEISFADAAAAVGCGGNEAQCRDDVLGTMGVDELVSISVSTAGSDTKVVVHRIPKGTPIKDAQSTVSAGQPLEAKLDADLGPLFGVKPVATPPPPTPLVSTTPTTPTPTTPAFGDAGGPRTAQTEPVTGAPNNEVGSDQPQPAEGRSNGPVIGMAVGGGLVVLSIIMWGEASATQGDINNAPTSSPTDFKNLQDLESKGDTYAALGNVFFVGGLVVAGVSGYFYWHGRRSHSSNQAMITPTLFDHGAGLALTFGGSP